MFHGFGWQFFRADLLQTNSESVANINQPGSTITVLSDSLAKFEMSSLRIGPGGVTVAACKEVATTAGDWKYTCVVFVDGIRRIRGRRDSWIAARKRDLTIGDGKDTLTLAAGQETTGDESSGDSGKNGRKRVRNRGAVPAAGRGAWSTPIAIGVGAGAMVGITTWVLLQKDNPASAEKPK
jgi:hypothetical protein